MDLLDAYWDKMTGFQISIDKQKFSFVLDICFDKK